MSRLLAKLTVVNDISIGYGTLSRRLLVLVLLLCPLSAQSAGVEVPGAGSILQQINPVAPPVPSSPGTGLRIEHKGGEKLPSSAPFPVKFIRITGNTVFGTAVLHALVQDAEGKRLTLAQLDGLAARITDYYHAHGYPLARAVIPAQTIRLGSVRIEVIEARFGKIRLDNRSRVSEHLLQDSLSALQSGSPISQSVLDRSLLLLNDIPGVVVNATLKPGGAAGTSDLGIVTEPGQSIDGDIAFDNYGNKYTGRARLDGSVNFINPLHHGDVLSASGLTSGRGMNYARLSYETLLSGSGTRLGGSYSALHYILGGALSNLNGHGTAEVGSVWLRHPFARTVKFNLYGVLQYDDLKLKDHIDASGIRTDRRLENWTAGLSGDWRDTFLSNSVNTWRIGLTSGSAGFDDAAAQLADSASAKTQGNFSKWNIAGSRLQELPAGNAVFLSFSGQWTNVNLDSAEKMVAGGPYTVRAYDMGVLSGDSGYLGSIELRHDLGHFLGQWQAIAFYDSEHLVVNRDPWVVGEDGATLSGAGMGLAWAGPDQWSARTYVATSVGPASILVPNAASARAWFEIGRSL